MAMPFGATRARVTRSYALLTPDGLVAGSLPGWHAARTYTVISPALGARFTQIHATLEAGGGAHRLADARSRLVFVQRGDLNVRCGEQHAQLNTGGYAYLSPDDGFELSSAAGSEIIMFEKLYQPLPGVAAPGPLFGNVAELIATPFLGDEAAMLKLLLPDTLAFDLAVNLFTFQPGATLPFVETHVMEHGMVFLSGQGVYRIDADYHHVQAGDIIWMAPFCPQWFVAAGKTPASYLYYKDVNR